MKYFIMETNPFYTNIPVLLGGSKIIDARNICVEKASELKRRYLFQIKADAKTFYTDVISHPFFLVSELLKKMIALYAENIQFKEAVLFDRQNKKLTTYYFPIVPVIDCLSDQSEMNRDRSILYKAVMCYENIKEHAIFKIKETKTSYVVIRLDFAESALRRGAQGLDLKEVELIV